MQTSHLRILAAALATTAVTLALAQQAPSLPPTPINSVDAAKTAFTDPDNAALLYFKTWLQKDYIDLKQPCADALQSGVPLWRPDAALAKMLRDQQGVVNQLLRATRRPTADWGLEYSQGIGLLLSHPAELRASARILACDARRCLGEGDMDGACERVAAIHRIVRHCATDRVLISSLVAIAINSVAHNEMRAILNTGRISTAGRDAILTESRLLAQPDGFGVKRGIEGERWWTSGWIRTIAVGPDAGKRLAEQLGPLLDYDKHKEIIASFPNWTESEINIALDQIDAFYVDFLRVWGTPEAEQQFAAISEQLENGKYGDLAKLLVPSLSKAHKANVKAQTDHAAAIKQLEGFVPYP